MGFGFRLLVEGDFACFTRPEFKAERVTYDVMTPTAARGILDAIYWKPEIRWIVDAIHVLKPIRHVSVRRNEVGAKVSAYNANEGRKSGSLFGLWQDIESDRQQRLTTLLSQVAYLICAHFDVKVATASVARHADGFRRRAGRGQCFHQPYMGVREFPAAFRLLDADEPLPTAQAIDMNLGFMPLDTGGNISFFDAVVENGILQIPQGHKGEDCISNAHFQ